MIFGTVSGQSRIFFYKISTFTKFSSPIALEFSFKLFVDEIESR